MRAPLVQRRDPEAGFTLTEILVVILIVGILAAIAIPAFLNQRGRAEDVAAKTQAGGAERAMVIYEQDHDTYACGDNAQCQTAMSAIDPALSVPSILFSASGGTTGDPTRRGYRVTTAAAQGRTFYVDQAPGAGVDHGCDLNGAQAPGGCHVAAGATAGSW